MKRNMSNLDRIIRVVIAAVLVYMYLSGIVTGTLGVILLVVGAVLLFTAIIAFCPLYWPFKISTYKN